MRCVASVGGEGSFAGRWCEVLVESSLSLGIIGARTDSCAALGFRRGLEDLLASRSARYFSCTFGSVIVARCVANASVR